MSTRTIHSLSVVLVGGFCLFTGASVGQGQDYTMMAHLQAGDRFVRGGTAELSIADPFAESATVFEGASARGRLGRAEQRRWSQEVERRTVQNVLVVATLGTFFVAGLIITGLAVRHHQQDRPTRIF